ncbi:MAG: hypothetical protein AAF491_11965 [Verrucomicrobiota bacterium]
MKLVSPTKNRQRGFVSGKIMFLLVIAAVVAMAKMHTDPGVSVSGTNSASLQAELGEPIKKEQIPRPR